MFYQKKLVLLVWRYSALPNNFFTEFECSKSKLCIPRRFVNSGTSECSTMLIQDNSDEIEPLPNCLSSEFPCNHNETLRCIPREWVGDGYNDCKSGIDERTKFQSCNNLTEFQCQINGRCIPRYRVLDGFSDCPNGTDEVTPLQCQPAEEFQCRDNGRCIPRSWRGNKVVNCLDGSDEVPMPSNETCADGEFRCHNNKRCIPMSLVCDGMDHCGDCSDEIESCEEPRLFRCPSDKSKCVHWSYSCDVYSDCPNNTDDFYSMPGFKCRMDFVAGSTQQKRYCSIPQWLLYDNYASCDDKSDLCFVNGSFVCTYCLNNKTIIAKRQVCDGVIDCPDFSDECLCSDKIKSSANSQTFCNNVCYGQGEKACQQCNKGELFCQSDNTCIGASQVCDQVHDCPSSNLDEAFCTLPLANTNKREEPDFECDAISPELKAALSYLKLEQFAKHAFPQKAKR